MKNSLDKRGEFPKNKGCRRTLIIKKSIARKQKKSKPQKRIVKN